MKRNNKTSAESLLLSDTAAVAATIRDAVAAGEAAESKVLTARFMLLDAAQAAYNVGWRALQHFNVAAAPDTKAGVKSLPTPKQQDIGYQHREENGAAVRKAIVEGLSDLTQAVLGDSRKRKDLSKEEQDARKNAQSTVAVYFARFAGYLLSVEQSEAQASMTDAEKAAQAKAAEKATKAEEKRRAAEKAPLTKLARALVGYVEQVDGEENSSDLEQEALTIVVEAIKELQALGVKLPKPKE